MVVNEEGLILDLPMNTLGCLLYGTQYHGSPIVGNIVIMKEGITSSGPDLIGLEDNEIASIIKQIRDLFQQKEQK